MSQSKLRLGLAAAAFLAVPDSPSITDMHLLLFSMNYGDIFLGNIRLFFFFFCELDRRNRVLKII